MHKEILRKFEAFDVITIAYAVLSGLLLLFGSFKLENVQTRILIRIAIVAIIVVVAIFLDKKTNPFLKIIRYFYFLPLLLYFISEGDYVHNIFFPDLDKYMANFELTIFSVHPGVWLSNALKFKFLSDIISLIYLSYFILCGYLFILVYKKNNNLFGLIVFLLLMTYYILFFVSMFCPVAGPQYYLVPPDNQFPVGGVFRNFTHWLLIHFDLPACAFPSASAIILCLISFITYMSMRPLFKFVLPLAILILIATIYLKIHYTIDVIAGLLSYPAIYWLSSRTYEWIDNILNGNIHSLSDFLNSIPKVYGKR
jgi:hypothetical protein